MGSGPSKVEAVKNNNVISEKNATNKNNEIAKGPVRKEEAPRSDDLHVIQNNDVDFDSKQETFQESEVSNIKDTLSVSSNRDISDFSEESIHLPAEQGHNNPFENDDSDIFSPKPEEEESEISLDKEVDNVLHDTEELVELSKEKQRSAEQNVKGWPESTAMKKNSVILSPLDKNSGARPEIKQSSIDNFHFVEHIKKDPAREFSRGRGLAPSDSSLPSLQSNINTGTMSEDTIHQQEVPPTHYGRKSEEWNISMKSIDGFDPQKFIAVNKKISQPAKTSHYISQEHRIEDMITESSTSSSSSKIKYDNSEEDLLESIEREFS